MIWTKNHGPLILSSTYWGSEIEASGKVWASANGGAVRLLIPRTQREVIEEMRAAKTVILSRGPWPEAGALEGVEILFDDGSDSPFALHLTPESFDLLPGEPPVGREWVLSVWDLKKEKPHKAIERPCHWRRVARIPYLKPLGE